MKTTLTITIEHAARIGKRELADATSLILNERLSPGLQICHPIGADLTCVVDVTRIDGEALPHAHDPRKS